MLGSLACGGTRPIVVATTPLFPPMTAHVMAAPADARSQPVTYPPSRRTDQTDVLHGVVVADPYRWLEDAKADDVRVWADAQDAVARGYLANIPGRDAIAARLRELFYVESTGAPRHVAAGGRERWFFPRRDAGKEKFTIYWREGKRGADKVLLDPNAWSNDGSASLGVWSVSRDGAKVAYTVKGNNSDEATLHVMDVATGKTSDVDVIDGAKYAWPSWTPSGDGFYYTGLPPLDVGMNPADRPGYAEVRFHKLASDPKTDRVVHEKTGDPKSFLGAGVDRTGRWLIATIEHGWTRTDVYFQDLQSPAPVWKPLVVGEDARYDVSVDADRFFVSTNEGAPRYRVLRVDPAHPERKHWTEIVAERADATLEAMSIVGHRLSLSYLKDVTSRLEVRDQDGKLVREIELPGLGSASAFSGEADDDVAYYSFQSFTYPTEIFETSMRSGETTTWYKLHVPADTSPYVVEQLFATSRDGTRIPFFAVHARDLQRNGETPTMLYGYGGFQAAQTPYFASSIFPWLERGGMWVIANLRGGSEYGEDWHRHGMRREKQNVFDDYFAVAEELVKQGFTKPEKLVALGGIQRWIARRRRPHATTESLSRGALRRAASRHGALRAVRQRQDVDRGVWVSGRRGRLRRALRVLPVSSRDEGNEIPRDVAAQRGQRRPRRSHARAQVRGRAPVGVGGRPRAAPYREARRPRRRRSRPRGRRQDRRRIRVCVGYYLVKITKITLSLSPPCLRQGSVRQAWVALYVEGSGPLPSSSQPGTSRRPVSRSAFGSARRTWAT